MGTIPWDTSDGIVVLKLDTLDASGFQLNDSIKGRGGGGGGGGLQKRRWDSKNCSVVSCRKGTRLGCILSMKALQTALFASMWQVHAVLAVLISAPRASGVDVAWHHQI